MTDSQTVFEQVRKDHLNEIELRELRKFIREYKVIFPDNEEKQTLPHSNAD